MSVGEEFEEDVFEAKAILAVRIRFEGPTAQDGALASGYLRTQPDPPRATVTPVI